jgi:Uma2 family endonuclease
MVLDNSCGNQFSLFSELTLDLNQWDSPDLSIFPKMELDCFKDEITALPRCAIEILSPSEGMQEFISKARKYFGYGVKSCWSVISGLKNIYVFWGSTDYQIFRNTQTLYDSMIEVRLELAKVFS